MWRKPRQACYTRRVGNVQFLDSSRYMVGLARSCPYEVSGDARPELVGPNGFGHGMRVEPGLAERVYSWAEKGYICRWHSARWQIG